MATQEEIERVFKHGIFYPTPLETERIYNQVIKLSMKEYGPTNQHFHTLNALQAIYELGVEQGKREERAKHTKLNAAG